MLWGVWRALNCLSIHATYCVMVAGASPGKTKMWAAVRENGDFLPIGHRKTEPGGYFCRKLTLTRTPDPIRPTRRGLDPNRPSSGKKQGRLWCKGVCPGSFGRTPPETIGDSRTKFNRILCTSKSEAAVTTNKKLRCMLKLTTDKHEASRGLSATAEFFVTCPVAFAYCCTFMTK